MKKLLIILLAATFFSANAQYCFTLYDTMLTDSTLAYNEISFLIETANGDIMFGGTDEYGGGMGLVYFNDPVVTLYTISNSSLPHNIVRCAAFDGDTTWLGTDGGFAGFVHASDAEWKIYTTDNGLPDNKITVVIINNGVKWLGFSNGNIASISNGAVTVYDAATTPITDFLIDQYGTLWAASDRNNKLFTFEGDAFFSHDETPSNISDLELDRDGSIWGIDNNTIYRIDHEGYTVLDSYEPLFDDVLYELEIDENNQIWITSEKGLLKFSNGIFQLFDPAISGVPEEHISDPIMIKSSGHIIFAYYADTDTSYHAGLVSLSVTPDNFVLSPTGNTDLCSGSALEIEASTGYTDYFWNKKPGTRSVVIDTAGIYAVAVKNGTCFSYDTVEVTIKEPYQNQEICVVTVDEGNIIVAWERTYNENIWYTNIYRESSKKDVYIKLDSIYIDDIQAYIDFEADPAVKSYKYRISVVDSCGNESEMSPPHKTIHLRANISVNSGVNLAWTQYEGQPILSYKISRGEALDVIDVTITEVASTDNSYYYQPPEDNGKYYYQVEAVLPFVCDPTAKKSRSGPFTRSVSNLKSVSNGEPSLDMTDTTLVAAAPVGTFISDFTLKFNGDSLDQHVILVDVDGEPSDNDMFTIINDSLFTNAVFSYDTSIIYTIWVGTGYVVEDPTVVADWSFDLVVNRLVGMENNVFDDRIHIYPNPAQEFTTIELPPALQNTDEIQLVDMTGRIIKSLIPGNRRRIDIDTRHIKPGVYIIRTANMDTGARLTIE